MSFNMPSKVSATTGRAQVRRGLRSGEPGHDRVAYHTHAMRVGDHDRPGQKSRLLDPRRTRHLTIAVEHGAASENGILRLFSAREDGSDPSPHGTFADDEPPVAFYQRRVPNFDARNVGDGVERARCAGKRNAEIAGARSVPCQSSFTDGESLAQPGPVLR